MRIVCIDGEHQYLDLVQRDVIDPLRAAGHDFDWFEESFTDAPATIGRASGYDALYVIGDQGPVPAGLMRANPQLSLISFVGTGARRFVDMAEAAECGVTVTNVPDFASISVAEHTIALLFAVARRIPEGDRLIRAGAWEKNQGLKLTGRRLGVVGAGPIAAAVMSRAAALGMEVVYWSRTDDPTRAAKLAGRRVELDELFRTSDAVTLHLAQTPETAGLIDATLLDTLRPGSVVVNTARAEIVDQAHLVELVASGHLFGAGIDVFESEPPSLAPEVLALPNLVLTPHIGFHTDEADDVFRLAGENILAFAAGEPRNVIA